MEFIIYPTKTPILGHLFGYPIRYYGVIMALVFLVGIALTYHLFNKKISKIEANIFLDYSPLVIFTSLIGARLFYILGAFDYYLTYPKEIIMLNHGGLSIFGAIFFGLITIFILSRKHSFSFLSHLDLIAVVFPLCQAIGRLGNYFNQEAYGLPTNGFLKLFVDEIYRAEKYSNYQYFHPTFLYEGFFDILIFILLICLLFAKKTLKKGTLACLYLILYSIVRFIIEGIRIDSVLNFSTVPVVQVICVVVFIFAFVLLLFLNKKSAE